MKKFRKMMALVMVVVLAMAMSSVVFAAAGDLTADGSISVSGIGEGDKVYVYQFVEWDTTIGNWKVNENAGLTLAQIADGLTQAELGTLASNKGSFAAIETAKAVTGGTYTNNNVDPGSYLVLIQSTDNTTLYNPIVVSNDYDPQSANTVALTANDASAKKQTTTLTKTADNAPDDLDVQAGDEVPFTVTSNVPTYDSNWTDPMFQIKDELSAGLTLKAEPTVAVAGYTVSKGTDYTLTDGTEGAKGYTVKFTESFLKRVAGNPVVTIKYTAIVGDEVKDLKQVHEETNKVTLEFSNNPEDSSDHGKIDKETHHYTFAIDASRMGAGGGSTSELIKVGVDSAGNTVTVFREDQLPTNVSPLAGAEFTLTGVGANNTGTVTMTATSDAQGRVFFNNLETGTYKLSETKAPVGYIKDNTEHTVVITAEYNDDTTLKSYTITIDNMSTDHYSATTSKIDSVVKSADNTSFPVVNTKGTELPSTGGIGTTLFYIIGTILVLGAGVVLVTRRRMNAQ